MPRMLRRIACYFGLASVALGVSVITMSCKDSGGTGAEGGTTKKFICKMNGQCWICQDDDQMNKCILNPLTSGCKLSTSGDCS